MKSGNLHWFRGLSEALGDHLFGIKVQKKSEDNWEVGFILKSQIPDVEIAEFEQIAKMPGFVQGFCEKIKGSFRKVITFEFESPDEIDHIAELVSTQLKFKKFLVRRKVKAWSNPLSW